MISFYKPESEYGCFSNFSRHNVIIYDNITFKTSEHAFMYKKAITFKDFETASQITYAKTPWQAKRLGRKVKPYNDNVWSNVKFDIMVDILRAKTKQNPYVLTKLLETGNKTIVEAAPGDYEWGSGCSAEHLTENFKGKNLLGKAWMKVRNEYTNHVCNTCTPNTSDVQSDPDR